MIINITFEFIKTIAIAKTIVAKIEIIKKALLIYFAQKLKCSKCNVFNYDYLRFNEFVLLSVDRGPKLFA